jgi:O-antigen/teichoic acid export membrane protein
MSARGSIISRYVAGWSSAEDRSRRASLNALAAGLDYVARTVVELVLNPLLVRGLGPALFGVWRVLWRWTGYVWATTGRSAQALQWAVTNRQHSDDVEEKRRMVGAAVVVWALFLPLLLAVGGAGVWAAPHLLRTPPDQVVSVRLAAALLVADAIAVALLTIPRQVLQGENLGYKRLGLSTALVVTQAVLTAVALLLDTGIVGVAVANILGTFVNGIVFWPIVRSYVPWFRVSRPTRHEVRWMFGLSWWFTGWKLITQLMVAGDVVVLGVFASVELVAVYSLTKFVPEAIISLMNVLLQGVGPGLGGLVGAGDRERAARARGEVLALTWLVATVAGAGVLLLNESFVRQWVGGRYYAGPLASLLIVVMIVQFIVLRQDAQIIDATLNVRSKVLLGFVSSAISLALAAVLVGVADAGIAGLCLGIIAGRTILSVGYPLLVGRRLGIPFGGQLLAALRPLATTAVLFAATTSVGRRIEVSSWPGLAGAALACLSLLVALAAGLGLSAEQRRRLRARLRALAGLREVA